MPNTFNELLKNNQLSITDSRVAILELFSKSNNALAHGDIEKATHDQYDRVTIYRTLQTFVEKGIIHSIPTKDNSVLYAFCKDACSNGNHHDNHVHFICDECGSTYCLDNVVVPSIILPERFIAERKDVIVSGICNNCNRISL